MWIPRSEAEIEAAIANGVLRETPTFDAKAALPQAGRNKDLARDICAMTVDGGVLLYGLGGHDPTRPDTLLPFDLAGAGERIDQVAQTAIAEAPTIEIHDFPSAQQDGVGYLGVVIPPSPRAPHMVTLDRDNRYYARGATGNRILTEAEVARLYALREQWDVDRDALLDRAISAIPFAYADPLDRIGPMVVIAHPVTPTTDLLRRAAAETDVERFVQREIPAIARASDPFPNQGTSGLGDAHRLTRRGSEVFVLSCERDPASAYQARAELGAHGHATYWHSPVLNARGRGTDDNVMFLMERSVTRAVHQLVASAAFLYERGGYVGSVDVALAVLDIEDARAATLARGFEPGPAYGAPEYRRHARVTMTELRNDVATVCRRLVEPLYDVISVQNYDAYADAVRRG